jgi:hypothetical protein
MGYTQAIEMANLMDLEQGIQWHLRYNLFPPVPKQMIPVAVEAVRLCRDYQFNETIVIFFEHQVYEVYGWSVPAYVIVDIFNLEPWVNELEVD